MPSRTLFATRLYEDRIDDPAFLTEMEDACRDIAHEDRAGRGWSKQHGYRGYTSYASLADLPRRDPRFAELARRLAPHVARFVGDCAFDLGGRKPKLDSLWVNLLKPGGGHSGHIHPHGIISGTFYVAVPAGAGGLRVEDPRLPLMMAAPTPRVDAPPEQQRFVTVAPAPGTVLLWESWLRHEVLPGTGRDERISVSFNYR
ncbi:MAG: TIGR02466 family protein [Sphingomonas sp.]